MKWLVTYYKDVSEPEMRARMSDIGAEVDDCITPMPMDETESVIEIEANQTIANQVSDAPWVIEVFPMSEPEPYD